MNLDKVLDQAGSQRPTPVPVPDFTLTDQHGQFFRLSDQGGRVVVLFFGYTHCPEVCPTTIADMSAVMGDLGDKAKDFRLFFITLDPARDTPQAMKDYVSNFDPRIEALVPTAEELPKLAKDFHIFYETIPSEDGNYTLNHTALVFLFNAKGGFNSTIAYDETKANRLAKMQKLLAAQ